MAKIDQKDIDFLTHLYEKTKTDPILKKKFKDFKDFCNAYINKETELYEKLTGNQK